VKKKKKHNHVGSESLDEYNYGLPGRPIGSKPVKAKKMAPEDVSCKIKDELVGLHGASHTLNDTLRKIEYEVAENEPWTSK